MLLHHVRERSFRVQTLLSLLRTRRSAVNARYETLNQLANGLLDPALCRLFGLFLLRHLANLGENFLGIAETRFGAANSFFKPPLTLFDKLVLGSRVRSWQTFDCTNDANIIKRKVVVDPNGNHGADGFAHLKPSTERRSRAHTHSRTVFFRRHDEFRRIIGSFRDFTRKRHARVVLPNRLVTKWPNVHVIVKLIVIAKNLAETLHNQIVS